MVTNVLTFGFVKRNDTLEASLQGVVNTISTILMDKTKTRSIFSVGDVTAAMFLYASKEAKERKSKLGRHDDGEHGSNTTSPPAHKWMSDLDTVPKDDDAKFHWLCARRYCAMAVAMYTWPVWMILPNPNNLWTFFRSLFHTTLFRPLSYYGKEVVGDGYLYRHTAAFFSEVNNNSGNAKPIGISDLHYASWVDGVWQTPFVVVTDDVTQAIVISIRGSTSPFDWITDASANINKFHDGIDMKSLLTKAHLGNGKNGDNLDGDNANFSLKENLLVEEDNKDVDVNVHEGMFLAALCIYGQVIRVIAALKENTKYKDYKVVVTGHSLGAGVASLLTFLLQKTIKHEYDCVRCYAFEPPGCMVSGALLKESQNHTLSFVVGDDIVPRISFNSMKQLHDFVQDTLSKKKTGNVIPPDSPIGANAAGAITSQDLFAPGCILHYTEKFWGGPIDRQWLRPVDLQQIILSPQTFNDHLAMRVQRIVNGQQITPWLRWIPFYNQLY